MLTRDVDLPVRQPFDAAGTLAFLAARAVLGVETADLTDPHRLRYARTLSLPHGPGSVDLDVTRADDGAWRVRARLELTSDADAETAVARARRMLDLDADPVASDAALAGDPALAPLVARTPGIRVPGAVDPHELVVRALVGQQISVAAARTHLGRLAAWCGAPSGSTVPGLTTLFPSAGRIASRVPAPVAGADRDPGRPLRLPDQSVRAILATAGALASGELAVHADADPAALRAALLARPRIGPWTASYIAMRVLGDADAWLTGDVALVAGARSLGLLDGDLSTARAHRALAEHATAWAPWRSSAMMHLWQAATRAAAAR